MAEQHYPLSVKEGNPANIVTADGKHVAISWASFGRGVENPYEEAEQFAAELVTAVNDRPALLARIAELDEALKATVSQLSSLCSPLDVPEFARAALAKEPVK